MDLLFAGCYEIIESNRAKETESFYFEVFVVSKRFETLSKGVKFSALSRRLKNLVWLLLLLSTDYCRWLYAENIEFENSTLGVFIF